jgi:7-cyano-7-deazaguanine synthase
MTSALLLSGGMDSSALAFLVRPSIGISVDYGQRCAEAEVRASRVIAHRTGLRHHIVRVDCSSIGSGQLAGVPVSPLGQAPEWWPFRNQLLVTLAAASIIDFGVDEILIGTVATDRQHADGTPEFVSRLNDLMTVQEGAIRVVAPAAALTSTELVLRSGIEAPLLAWTHSCHRSTFACGDCRGCFKRDLTLRELGWTDGDDNLR